MARGYIGSIYVPNKGKYAAKIISEYFAAGALGLRDDIRQSYERQHRAFMERQQAGHARGGCG